MKRFIALLLVIALSFTLSACDSNTETKKPKKDNNNKTEEKKEDSILLEKNGYIYIKYDRFGELLERVELTKENWQEYINVYPYENTTTETDAFGEFVTTHTTHGYYIGASNERYHHFQDALIELKNKQTGELKIYCLDRDYKPDTYSRLLDEYINLDDYECTRITGLLYFVDLPEEAILSPVPNWGYQTGFIINDGGETPYEIDADTKFIHLNGGMNWDNFLK